MKPRILDPKIEEFTCLVHKLSVTLTAVKIGVKNIQTAGYNGARAVVGEKMTRNGPKTFTSESLSFPIRVYN